MKISQYPYRERQAASPGPQVPALVLILLFITPCCSTAWSQTSDRAEQRQKLLAEAEPFERFGKLLRASAEFAGPSIVHIESKQLKAVSPTRSGTRGVQVQVEESGSGIIADVDGKRVVLTNRHVVEDVPLDAIKIQTLDRRLLTPTQVLTNADFDVAAVVVAEAAVAGERPIPAVFADSAEVGDIILTVGSPFGLDRSVSMGIVSATNRRRVPASVGPTPRVGFYQIDAAVNPGSSGGPMLNLRGEVVGVVTAIATQGGGNEGVAFAIPAKTVMKVVRQLVKNGVVMRPYIGIGFDAAFGPEERKQLGIDRMVGARINQVQANSPASQAGLQANDVILRVDQTDIEDDIHFVELIAQSEIDAVMTLNVLRNGTTLTVPITLGSQISR